MLPLKVETRDESGKLWDVTTFKLRVLPKAEKLEATRPVATSGSLCLGQVVVEVITKGGFSFTRWQWGGRPASHIRRSADLLKTLEKGLSIASSIALSIASAA